MDPRIRGDDEVLKMAYRKNPPNTLILNPFNFRLSSSSVIRPPTPYR